MFVFLSVTNSKLTPTPPEKKIPIQIQIYGWSLTQAFKEIRNPLKIRKRYYVYDHSFFLT